MKNATISSLNQLVDSLTGYMGDTDTVGKLIVFRFNGLNEGVEVYWTLLDTCKANGNLFNLVGLDMEIARVSKLLKAMTGEVVAKNICKLLKPVSVIEDLNIETHTDYVTIVGIERSVPLDDYEDSIYLELVMKE